MWFDISTSWLLLVSLIALSICWLRTKTRRSYSKYNVPPYPVQPWPLFGHFFLLFGNLRDNMKKWRQKCGDIYSLDLVGNLEILFNDVNDIKEIWVKHADKIINPAPSSGDDILHEYNTGIFTARDDNWKEQRAISLSILRSLGMGKNIMAENILEEVRVICKQISSWHGQPKDIAVLLNACILNVISSVMVGKRFDHDDPEVISFISQLDIYVKYYNVMIFLTPLKQVFSLPGDIFHAKEWAKAAWNITENYSKPFLRQHQLEFKENEDPRDFVTAYLKEMKRNEGRNIPSNLNENNLTTLIRSMFVGGGKTASTTILWCLLYMLHHPVVQEKVFREIEDKVGSERPPNMTDRPNLIYLNAVILETQRLASVAPVGLRREVSETFEFRGFTIPKGSVLWPVLDSVHHDQKIWGDPQVFRPERFIDAKGALVHRDECIPFGFGKRVCLGESLAKMELFLFLSTMFQRFRFEPVDKTGKLPTLKESLVTVAEPQPFQMRFIERV